MRQFLIAFYFTFLLNFFACCATKGKFEPACTSPTASPPIVGAAHAEGEENIMIYGEVGRPRTLDPITSNDMITIRLSELIFDGLVRYNKVWALELQLADDYDVSKDGLTYMFHIHPKIPWHKGGYLTAWDVESTYELIKKTLNPFQSSLDFIESAQALDAETIVIKLAYPVASPLERMMFKILPGGINNLGQPGTAFGRNPNGTGPFKVDKFSDTSVQLSRSTSLIHRPRIERIIQKSFSTAELAVFALLKRQIDLLPEVPIEAIPNILGASSYLDLRGYDASSYASIGFNMRNPILADKRIRQALIYALDRKGMLNLLYHDYGELISGPFPPNSPGYDKSIEPIPFDPQKAQELLDEAGFTSRDKDGYRLNLDGQKLEFKFKVPVPTNDPQSMTTQYLFLGYVDAMEKIGVKINIEFRPRAAWRDEVYSKHDFDLTYIEWNFSNPVDITTLFHSKFTGPGNNNIVGYTNPDVDLLLDQSKKATSAEEIKVIYHKLHKIIHDDCPYTFLWSIVKFAAYNVRLHKVTIGRPNFFEFIDEWHIEGER